MKLTVSVSLAMSVCFTSLGFGKTVYPKSLDEFEVIYSDTYNLDFEDCNTTVAVNSFYLKDHYDGPFEVIDGKISEKSFYTFTCRRSGRSDVKMKRDLIIQYSGITLNSETSNWEYQGQILFTNNSEGQPEINHETYDGPGYKINPNASTVEFNSFLVFNF